VVSLEGDKLEVAVKNGSCLLVLPGFMMADRASGGRAQQTVMTRHVPRGTADHGTLDASLCVSWNHRHGNEQRQYETAQNCFHTRNLLPLSFQPECPAVVPKVCNNVEDWVRPPFSAGERTLASATHGGAINSLSDLRRNGGRWG
jgi:hypothetical protein